MITIHYNSLRALVKASFENNIKDNELKENEIAAYFIIWYKPKNGKRKAKSLSILRYGHEQAFQLACDYRNKMIQELNAQGAGYSSTHGK